jgi:hypothetical protein
LAAVAVLVQGARELLHLLDAEAVAELLAQLWSSGL